MGNFIVYALLLLHFLGTFTLSSVTKRYRSDYVYNRKTDAFYKLHTESMSNRYTRNICSVEGAQLMVPTGPDIVQLHGMFKNFPDLGEYVWVESDGKDHESAEEAPLIDLTSQSGESLPVSKGPCDVVSRKGEIDSYPCYRQLPFMCKVNAKDAPHDSHCGVYGIGYKYFANTGSCYKISDIAYSWNQAYAECQAQGAHLVILNSETEMMVVKNLTHTEPRVIGARFSWFFLAGFRADTLVANTTRVFKTIFNQTLQEAGFSEWSPNEPNNAYSKEDCGTIFMNDGKFNDVSCTELYPFICEKEVQS